jgi:hypothetical protein
MSGLAGFAFPRRRRRRFVLFLAERVTRKWADARTGRRSMPLVSNSQNARQSPCEQHEEDDRAKDAQDDSDEDPSDRPHILAHGLSPNPRTSRRTRNQGTPSTRRARSLASGSVPGRLPSRSAECCSFTSPGSRRRTRKPGTRGTRRARSIPSGSVLQGLLWSCSVPLLDPL